MLEALYNAIRKDADPKEMTIGERAYTTAKIFPVELAQPVHLKVKTLTALVDYLNSNVDGHDVTTLLCHVESPESVALYSGIIGDFEQRKCYLRISLEQLQLRLNTFLDGETFNILLQSCFIEPEDPMKATDRGLVLAYAANVTESIEGNTLDDGVTQQVTVRKGIASKGTDILPNSVTLRPYRTFTEVEQPASKFVFRAKTGPEFALIEADGGAWKSEAMKNIKMFMKENIPDLSVIA